MTNSLREEIFELVRVFDFGDSTDERLNEHVNNIISKIEKRIDSIPTRHDSNTVEEVNYTNGWNHAISKMRDMLK